MLRNLSRISH